MDVLLHHVITTIRNVTLDSFSLFLNFLDVLHPDELLSVALTLLSNVTLISLLFITDRRSCNESIVFSGFECVVLNFSDSTHFLHEKSGVHNRNELTL